MPDVHTECMGGGGHSLGLELYSLGICALVMRVGGHDTAETRAGGGAFQGYQYNYEENRTLWSRPASREIHAESPQLK